MTEPKIMCWQHICAPNDTNGNPRRCYVGYDVYGEIVIVTDEGYAGRPSWTYKGAQLASINVPASEYKAFLVVGKAIAS